MRNFLKDAHKEAEFIRQFYEGMNGDTTLADPLCEAKEIIARLTVPQMRSELDSIDSEVRKLIEERYEQFATDKDYCERLGVDRIHPERNDGHLKIYYAAYLTLKEELKKRPESSRSIQ